MHSEYEETQNPSQKLDSKRGKQFTTKYVQPQARHTKHTTVLPQVQRTRVPSSLARPNRVDTTANSARTAPTTDRKRMRGKATPQCKQQIDGIGLALVAKDRSSRDSKRKRELASKESSSIYRRPRRFITGFNEPMII